MNKLLKILFLFFFFSCFLQAQFKKEFEKTQSKKVQEEQENKKPTPVIKAGQVSSSKAPLGPLLAKVPDIKQGKKRDAFGRSKTQIDKGIEGKKYVTLNPETAFGPEVIKSFDFPEIDIVDLTKHMQKLTGIPMIMGKEVKGKISILAPSPITVGDAWKAYLTALNSNGLALIKSGAFYKIINAREARTSPVKIYTGNYTPDTENMMMRIIPLQHINVAEVGRQLRPLGSRNGRMSEIKQTNTLIILDTGAKINRFIQLLKFLDVPGHDESLQIVQVKYSSAVELAKILDDILKSQGGGTFRGRTARPQNADKDISRIIAEPRTNSIIAMATSKGGRQLRSLIEKLDVEFPATGGNGIHVYYLQHGDSENLAKTLNTLVSNSPGARGRSRFTKGSPSQQNNLFAADVKVTSDKSNNALVVTASPTDYLTIKSVISKLDIPRNQVYVEGMMLETELSNGHNLGIGVAGAYGSGITDTFGFQPKGSPNVLGMLLDPVNTGVANLSDFFLGLSTSKKHEIEVNGNKVKIGSVQAFIKALATDVNSNVLATPQILALDNQEATVEVGQTVQIQRTDATAAGTSTSFVEKPITLNLTITPHVNTETRMIKLDIDQKIDNFAPGSDAASGGAGLTTSTRKIKTQVIVRDRDTIAMGGLMKDEITETHQKVPLLGDIPVIGWLFKNTSKQKKKTNLMIFLTPRILSPYAPESAKTMKDLLNRRAAHLKNSPFQNTVKGLYRKADKQEKGPLYEVDKSIPDYKSIELENERNKNTKKKG